MSLMYLHLRTDERGHVHAEIKDDGKLHNITLGSANSQLSIGPFAVFKIEGITGWEHVPDRALEAELMRRFGPDRLHKRIAQELTTAQLLAIIGERAERASTTWK